MFAFSSARDEFQVPLPKPSVSEIKDQTPIQVKEEPCSSDQSASEESASSTANQYSTRDTSSHSSSLIKEEPCSSVPSAFVLATSGTSNSDTSCQNSIRVKEQCHLDVANNLLQQSDTMCAERHPKGFFICDKCNKCFMSQNLLTNHYKMHIKLEADANNYYENYYTYSKTQSHNSCDICNISFNIKGARKKHFHAVHSKNKRCSECGRSCNSRKQLVRHNRRFHEGKLVKCDVCSKRFLRNKDLKRHYRIHVGENTRGWYMVKSESSTVIEACVLAKKEPMLSKSEFI